MPEHHTVGEMLAVRPAIRPALALACGIWAADALALTPSTCYVFIVISVVAALLSRRYIPAISGSTLLLLLASVGMSWTAQATLDRIAHRPASTDPNTPRSFEAHILDPPVQSGTSWAARADLVQNEKAYERRSHFRARLQIPFSCLRDSLDPPRAGERWLLDGAILPFPRPRNPGEFDYGAYLSASGADAVVRASRVHHVLREREWDIPSALGETQERLYHTIDLLHSGERAAFLKGVILGYRSELSEDLKQAFLMTGTVHILAVSGGNVALIAGVAMVLFGVFRTRRRTVALFACAAILGYMWVTGSSPSVVRATVMALIILGGAIVGRRTDVYQSLSVAALLLLVLDPRTLFDPGFQLSFLSVLAIVLGSPMIARMLDRWPEEFRDQPVVRATLQLMAISLAAQIGTLPLTVGMFGQISFIAVVANVAVVPLSGAALVIGVVEMLLAPISQWVAGVYATVNDQVMDLILGLVRVAASLPLSAADVGRPDAGVVWGSYAVLGALIAGALPRLRACFIVVALLCANTPVWIAVLFNAPPGTEVVTLDVGQGDAHCIRTAGGRTILIDTGPTPFTAERAVIPFLRRWGVDTLDLLIITHPHRDHNGGLDRLLDHVPVRTLAVGDVEDVKVPTLQRLTRSGGRLLLARRGGRLEPDSSIRLYALHPGPERLDRSANNRSVVVRLVAGSSSMLFTGDMELESEDNVASRYGTFIRSQVLKVAHHGSSTGTTDAWLSTVAPDHAVISVGWGNTFGHPDPEVLDGLRRKRIQVSTTQDDGAIWWVRDDKGWTRVSW